MFRPSSATSDNTRATDDVPDLHHFAVLATDSAGDTYLSNIQTADYSVPRYPADLAATALADGNIGVTWSNSAFNESGGILKRSSDGGTTWTSIASLSTDQTAFLDTTAPAGVDVLYEVEYTRTNDSGLAESGYDVMTTPVVPLYASRTHNYEITALNGKPLGPVVIAPGATVTLKVQVTEVSTGIITNTPDLVVTASAALTTTWARVGNHYEVTIAGTGVAHHAVYTLQISLFNDPGSVVDVDVDGR